MASVVAAHPARGLALMLGWRRIAYALAWVVPGTALLSAGWESPLPGLVLRTSILGLVGLVVFGLLEQWPRRLPSWLARWALQVVAVGIAMPVSTVATWMLSTQPGAPPFWEVSDRLEGFGAITVLALFLAPWAALAALVRQREAWAREQALAFDLERSEFERQALDARLRLLQAQVAPHFLFNTLANVQALVEAGSPRAPAVLRSLVAYLRAAVPRLNEPATTLEQELQLVQAYLELMHMRIPDRLDFALHVDAAARGLRCPPMTLLTLVENAVRHGIDPSEEGGRIDVHVERRGARCVVRVLDTGVGLGRGGGSLGTGLATLRERLQLAFGADLSLRVGAIQPRGVCAELDMPAREAQA